jgi:anaerobic selenocysteine-containing dehydrogenase
MTVHYTTCNICEATCGLAAHVEGGRVTRIEPDHDHVASQGYACVKGLKLHEVQHSPDRLMYPQKRVGDRFVRISWEQALLEIGAKARELRERHGGDALSVYLGNPISFNFLAPMLAAGFAQGLGTKNFFQTGSQDCNNKFVVAQRMYGFPFVQPYPDVDRTSFLICVGSNPAVSRMSFIQLPDPVRRLKAIERRGGRVVFVNPRRTESARQLGEQVFIRPDTDVFFYLSFLREVLQRGVPTHHVQRHMSGFEQLEPLVREWTPEKTARVTGIDPDVLRGLVTDYLAADGAALFCSTGVNQGSRGTLAFWLQEVINAITGNLDRPGGTLVGQPIVPDLMRMLRKTGNTMRTDRSRVGNLPSCVDSFPAGIMADEMLTPGPGQVRALFVFSGNPVLSIPNSGGRLTEALRELELLVTVDIFRSETGQLAHYVLPGTTSLQRPNIPFVFQTFMAASPTPYMQYSDRVLPPEAEQRDEVDILLQLADACGAPLFGSRAVSAALGAWQRVGRLPGVGAALGLTHERLLDVVLRATKQGSRRSHRDTPHGVPRPPHNGGDFLGSRVVTDDGRVQLAPAEFMDMARTLSAAFDAEVAQRKRLKLVSKREPLSHNSWMHNVEHFVRGKHDTNYVYMHPDDASAAGLGDGDMATVSNAAGRLTLPVAVTDDMMPGAVALPHGWGHQEAPGLRVASATRGQNVNLLSHTGPEALEPLSGMAQLSGIVVDVGAATATATSTTTTDAT